MIPGRGVHDMFMFMCVFGSLIYKISHEIKRDMKILIFFYNFFLFRTTCENSADEKISFSDFF